MPTIRNKRGGALGPLTVRSPKTDEQPATEVTVLLRPGDNVITDPAQLEALANNAQAQTWFRKRWIEVVRDVPATDLQQALTDDDGEDLPPAA